MTDLPTNANDFIAFMEQVWADKAVPTADGGIQLFWSDLYDKYHNARHTAQACGARRTGGTRRDGMNADVYKWPDGTRVAIATGKPASTIWLLQPLAN